MIPVFRPEYNTGRILAELEPVLASGWTGLGPKTEQFERALAARFETDYAVFLNSCTAALHLAVEALALEPGQKVLVPDITFVSTAAAVRYADRGLVLAPVEERTLCLDLDYVERALERDASIGAVIVVHYSGNACDMDRLVSLCGDRNVRLIEDCAHAFGSTYKGRALGTFGDLGCLSFHAVKNLPIGDGGAVLGRDEYRARLNRLRWMGIDRSTYERTATQRYSYSYEIDELGYKCHGNDVGAVIGLCNLDLVDAHNERRRAIWRAYATSLPQLTIHAPAPYVATSQHLVSCFVEARDEFIDFMAARGVQIGVHYRPVSAFKAYAKYADEETRRRSDATFRKLATLPCYPRLTDGEIEQVVGAVREFTSRLPRAMTRA